MILKITLGVVLVLSGFAGVAGFILSIKNYRKAKKAHTLAIEAHQLAKDAPKHQVQRDTVQNFGKYSMR
jgi:hypothetical protein